MNESDSSGLILVKIPVKSASVHEFFMGPLINDPAVFHHDDLVCECEDPEAVRHDDDGSVLVENGKRSGFIMIPEERLEEEEQKLLQRLLDEKVEVKEVDWKKVH